MTGAIFNRVAIVGGTGSLGTYIVKALLSESNIPITIIGRAGSEASPPQDSRVSLKRGDYDSQEFLQETLRGHDVVVCTLGLAAPPTILNSIHQAAGAVGVKWIVPQGWGNDFQNDGLTQRIPPMQAARASRTAIVNEGMSYTGFITNPWLDWNIKSGNFSIDVNARQATIYTGSVDKFNVTTLAQVGRAVARFLMQGSQPTNSTFRAEDYRNREIYIKSFLVSQQDLLDSVQRVTNTTPEDWKVTKRDVQEYMDEGTSLMQQGDFMNGLFKVLFACLYTPALGGNYDDKVANNALGLPQEELDEEIKKAVEA
ncbi:hypothetical protein H2202_000406 [Exophiala xenobiotica]|nr:hypothetical protein H2202_000406 [Exophiala xenobiotica]KAK5194052.1 hypothetical protein LTR92_006392 [Exophiala xenobiotica]KAK5222709.1 hypothetical protein LTR72_005546 [Exophiala xenobiotica]KAK5233734.1 hypothetical protein LTR47_005357 [Exophiala xenobiotica]KAK5247937.1 hypothetical protein LTS06_006926 [Exophiala xenobiotica]